MVSCALKYRFTPFLQPPSMETWGGLCVCVQYGAAEGLTLTLTFEVKVIRSKMSQTEEVQ